MSLRIEPRGWGARGLYLLWPRIVQYIGFKPSPYSSCLEGHSQFFHSRPGTN